MPLAKELIEAGARLVVLEYVDLIARFWTDYKPHFDRVPGSREGHKDKIRMVALWKEQIAVGRVPDYYLWHTLP